ncbi:MAG TPA: hypothetical protein VEW07_07750 [Solirubrobacterales bacterium]|nr:hypothetical protein [Solirubrobacterales bacterium]
MSPKTKALGLALIAVLAMNAMSALAAQANAEGPHTPIMVEGDKVTAGEYPAILTATDLKAIHGELARWTFGIGSRYVECTTPSISATITEASTAVTFQPGYEGCFSNGLTTVPATIDVNSCDYVLEATSETTGQLKVACTKEGDAIQVHVYENAAKHAEGKPICTYDIGPQGPITGVKISHTNKGTATEDLVLNLSELAKFNVTSTMGGLAVCGVNGTSGHAATTASLRGEYTVTGEEGTQP